jgi:ribonuclease P/MRP protein subunit RPP40
MEQGFDVIVLFLDLSKAFDSVPHVPLLHHLKYTGLNPYIVQWIAFYLLNRKQYVVVQGESSTDTSVVSGDPQGSVLGPLLFLSSISQLPLVQWCSNDIVCR